MSRTLYGLSECKIHVLSRKTWLRDSSHLPGLIIKKHKFAAACEGKRCRNSEMEQTLNDWANKIGKTRNVVLYYKGGGIRCRWAATRRKLVEWLVSISQCAWQPVKPSVTQSLSLETGCLKLWDHFSTISEHRNQQTETEVLFLSTSTAHCFLSACISARCRQLLIR